MGKENITIAENKQEQSEDCILFNKAEYREHREKDPEQRVLLPVPQSQNKHSDLAEFGVYSEGGKYRTQTEKRGEQIISNFVFVPLYQFPTMANISTFLVKYYNANTGIEGTTELDTKQLYIVSELRTAFGEYGCIWKGSQRELANLLDKLTLYTDKGVCIETLGYNKEGDFYAFSNALITNSEIKYCNEYGIVSTSGKAYYLPYSAKTNIEKGRYEDDRCFRYEPNEGINASYFLSLIYQSFGKSGYIAAIFTLGALFYDIIFSVTKFFPYLFIFGQRGTGKTTLLSFLLSIFGKDIKGVSVAGGTTKKGAARTFSQRNNSIIYLKEYTNNIDKDYDSMLKVVYDGQSYTTAQTSNNNETSTRKVNSAIIIDANELATNNDAVNDRCITIELRKTRHTDEETQAHDTLKELEKKTFTDIVVELMKYRGIFENDFLKLYKHNQQQFEDKGNSARTNNHSALILTIRDILENIGIEQPINREETIKTIDEINEQKKEDMNTIDPVTIFWESVSYEIENGFGSSYNYYLYDEITNTLFINLEHFKQAYSIRCKNIDFRNNVDFTSLKRLITDPNNKDVVERNKPMRIRGNQPIKVYGFRVKNDNGRLTINDVDMTNIITNKDNSTNNIVNYQPQNHNQAEEEIPY